MPNNLGTQTAMGKYSSEAYSDNRLLELVRREDDRAAFSELYLRYWDTLNSAAYKRLKSIEASEEAVQDLFVELFVKRKELLIPGNVEAYLKAALKFKVLKVFRYQQVRGDHELRVAWEYAADDIGADARLDNKLLRERIYRLAEKMPDKCREVFLLSRFEQLPQQEIAQRLNISVSTVKKHLAKAMSILRSELDTHRADMILVFLILLSI